MLGKTPTKPGSKGFSMDTMKRLQELALRLDQIETSGDWLSQAMEGRDAPAANTGVLISSLAEDVRARLLDLVTELEKEIVVTRRMH